MDYRQLAVHMLDRTGLAWLMQPVFAGHGVVVGLHRVQPRNQISLMPGNDISVDLVYEMLSFFKRANYDLISISEIPERLRSRSGHRFAVITFDDGFLDTFTLALPIFRQFGAPLTVFPVTGVADRSIVPWWVVAEWLILNHDEVNLDNPKSGRLLLPCKKLEDKIAAFAELSRWGFRDAAGLITAMETVCERTKVSLDTIVDKTMLSWSQMREMQRDPLVTFGIHTVSHLILTTLSHDRAVEEIAGAQQSLQAALGVPICHIAYPFGWCGPREFQIATDLGVKVGVTVHRGTVRSSQNPLALPRIMPSMATHANSMGFVRSSVYGLWNHLANLANPLRYC